MWGLPEGRHCQLRRAISAAKKQQMLLPVQVIGPDDTSFQISLLGVTAYQARQAACRIIMTSEDRISSPGIGSRGMGNGRRGQQKTKELCKISQYLESLHDDMGLEGTGGNIPIGTGLPGAPMNLENMVLRH